MESKIKEIIKNIITKEELIFFLKEINEQKLELAKEECSKLEERLRSLPEIKLEIAFHADDDFIKKVSWWLEKELGKKIILNIIVNPKVVGGAIIEYQGKWRDFSLAKKIDRLFGGK